MLYLHFSYTAVLPQPHRECHRMTFMMLYLQLVTALNAPSGAAPACLPRAFYRQVAMRSYTAFLPPYAYKNFSSIDIILFQAFLCFVI